jgi:hypothetical protein
VIVVVRGKECGELQMNILWDGVDGHVVRDGVLAGLTGLGTILSCWEALLFVL